MASSTLTAAVKAFAEEVGAIVWNDIPLGGPKVVWPDGDLDAFLDKVRPLAPAVVYLEVEGDLVAVAIAGVIHLFVPNREGSGQAHESREFGLVLPLVDGDEFDEDDEEDLLSPAQQDLAMRIAADFRYDGDNADELIDEAGIDGDASTYRKIRWEIERIYDQGVGAKLELESLKIVRQLISHPDFDPLDVEFRDEETHPYILEALLGKDFRLVRMVERGLREAAWQKGRYENAVREVKAQATQLLDDIPRLVLDQVGFATRNATRDALLEPYLDSVVERRRSLTGHWIKQLDAERGLGRKLEIRYAAAAQRLLVGVATKTATARTLRMSTGVLDRLLRAHIPAGFEFDDNDPIVIELAPELRG